MDATASNPDAAAGACSALHDRLSALSDSSRASVGAPAVAMSVITSRCGLWQGASGESSPGVALTNGALFRIGSATKTYVAALVLQLAQEGKLSLDDTLDRWSPAYPEAALISIRQLLNHTSGAYNFTDDPTFRRELAAHPGRAFGPGELIGLAAGHPPVFAPGETRDGQPRWAYSNTNYLLLGQIIEATTGARIADEIRTRLLAPLGLEATFFAGEERISEPLAHGYTADNDDITDHYDAGWAWASGAIVASSADLAEWAYGLYGGLTLSGESHVVSAAMRDQMLSGWIPMGPGTAYSLGVMQTDFPTRMIGHRGAFFGYASQITYLPAQKSAIAVVANRDGARPEALVVLAAQIIVNFN